MKRANEQVRTKAYQGYQERATFLIEGHQETFTVYAKSPYRLIIATRRRRRRRRRSDRRCYTFKSSRRELFPPYRWHEIITSLTVRTAFLNRASANISTYPTRSRWNSSRTILFFQIFDSANTEEKTKRARARRGSVSTLNENAREKNNCRPSLFLFPNDALRVLSSSCFPLFSLIRSNPLIRAFISAESP